MVRAIFSLPAPVAGNHRLAGAACEVPGFKVKGNAEHRQEGFTKRRCRGLVKPPVCSARTGPPKWGL